MACFLVSATVGIGVAMLAILLVAWGAVVAIVDYFKFKKRKVGSKESIVK